MILQVHLDVTADLLHTYGQYRLLAAIADVALGLPGVLGQIVLHIVHHVLQNLREDGIEEMVDCGEVELGVEDGDVLLVVPEVLLLLLRPIVIGIVPEDLGGEERDEVDFVVPVVAKAVKQLVFLGPLHDVCDLLWREVRLDAHDLGLGPWVDDDREVVEEWDVVCEGLLVIVCLQTELLHEVHEKTRL